MARVGCTNWEPHITIVAEAAVAHRMTRALFAVPHSALFNKVSRALYYTPRSQMVRVYCHVLVLSILHMDHDRVILLLEVRTHTMAVLQPDLLAFSLRQHHVGDAIGDRKFASCHGARQHALHEADVHQNVVQSLLKCNVGCHLLRHCGRQRGQSHLGCSLHQSIPIQVGQRGLDEFQFPCPNILRGRIIDHLHIHGSYPQGVSLPVRLQGIVAHRVVREQPHDCAVLCCCCVVLLLRSRSCQWSERLSCLQQGIMM
mmetsp:Transcript_23487/g.65565  ORF Transcript_23487/g.65565 Transcript_23487/m.65565 type:complete len:257 (+) Transcript_23487:266-1036(+)